MDVNGHAGYLLQDALHRAARLYPDRLAATDGETTYTYRQLLERCRRLASALESLGVSSGDRVATLLDNGHRYLEAYFAVPGSGAVLVPLNNRHAEPEHRYILTDCAVSVLIVDETHADIGDALAGDVQHVLRGPDEYEARLAEATPMDLTHPDPEGLAALFYTGGTTGASKGVMLSHRNLAVNALQSALGLRYDADDVYLHAAPMFHQADGLSTYAITWVGGSHVFVPRFAPTSVLDVIEGCRVTCTTLVPTMITSMLEDPRLAERDLSSLRLVIHGGAPISTSLLRRAIDGIGASFTQAYGMTEAAPLLTLLPREEDLATGDGDRLRSAGREVAGVVVTVRRPDGSECAVGEVGEVVARGPNIMQGYWNKADQTAAVLRDGWYWTGDLGYFDEDRYLYLVDRAKDMIISGGENVYSTEVEDAVAAHPAVLEAAVFGVPDDKWGERVHAAVVLRDGHQLDLEDLRSSCAELIADYKCPRSMEVHAELPRSGAGKILKRELRERHWSGATRMVH